MQNCNGRNFATAVTIACAVRTADDTPVVGLRERKKLRTREAIAAAALDLFAAQGFGATTIRQIAEAADVAPRTVSGYFPVKEELVFPDHEQVFDRMAERLSHRSPGETAVDALRAWLIEFLEDDAMADLEGFARRRQVIESDPALRIYERGLQERAERVVAAAVAVDLGLPDSDLVPHMVGAATLAALDALGRQIMGGPADGFRERALGLIDEAMTFIGAGVGGLAERAK
jgi:AcrR family transcriptional regulator